MDFFRRLFDESADVVASAPGRVEVLGNHTDYNGGTVLGAAIDLRLRVGVRRRTDRRIRLASTSGQERLDTSLDAYRGAGGPDWTLYPLGVTDELLMHAPADVVTGFDLAVDSEIPTGAGVSSSAALELATALALNHLWSLDLGIQALIRLAHRAENRYVGVPCGLLDQAVCGAGREGALVIVRAAENRIELAPFPPGTRLVLCATHVRRALAGSMYETRYDECRRALTAFSGFIPRLGRLTDLHPVDAAVYGPALDPVLSRRARHVVGEEFRVRRLLEFLGEADRARKSPHQSDRVRTALEEAGRLLTASHRSSQMLFENSSPELDFLVDRFTEKTGVLGARLTGAGWGGAMIAWVDDRFADEDLVPIIDTYRERFDAEADARFVRPSQGAQLD